MKPLKSLKVILILAFSSLLLLQPFSLNTDYFYDKAFAQTNDKPNQETTSNEDCGCDNPDRIKNPKETKAFHDKKIIKNIQKDINKNNKSENGYYKSSDFSWDDATATDYGSNEFGLTIPLLDNTDEEQVVLFVGYNGKTKEIGSSILMKMELVNNDVEISYRTLSNEKIVGLVADRESKTVVKEDVVAKVDTDGLFITNEAQAGYTDRVVKCLKRYWNNAPEYVKWICGGACGSALWGPNPINLTGCASCLGAAAMVCLIDAA